MIVRNRRLADIFFDQEDVKGIAKAKDQLI